MLPVLFFARMKALSFAGTSLLLLLLVTAFNNYFPSRPLDPSKKIDRIVVKKSRRIMEVYCGSDLLKAYRIPLGPSPSGHKENEGDGKTPEGKYHISMKNPNSRYYLSLRISYPAGKDKERASKTGSSPGGDIMIHGLKFGATGKLHLLRDWTQGCIAVTNREIEELYGLVETGTEIEILP
jgi:murein L,D-transpeptidase YafK